MRKYIDIVNESIVSDIFKHPEVRRYERGREEEAEIRARNAELSAGARDSYSDEENARFDARRAEEENFRGSMEESFNYVERMRKRVTDAYIAYMNIDGMPVSSNSAYQQTVTAYSAASNEWRRFVDRDHPVSAARDFAHTYARETGESISTPFDIGEKMKTWYYQNMVSPAQRKRNVGEFLRRVETLAKKTRCDRYPIAHAGFTSTLIACDFSAEVDSARIDRGF